MHTFHLSHRNEEMQPMLRTTGQQHQQWSESQHHKEIGMQGEEVTVNTPETNPKLQEYLKQMNSMIEANNSMVRNMMASMYNPMFQLPSSTINLS